MRDLSGLGAVGGEGGDDVRHPHLAAGGGGVGGSGRAPGSFMATPATVSTPTAISSGNTCKPSGSGSNSETHLDIKCVVDWD